MHKTDSCKQRALSSAQTLTEITWLGARLILPLAAVAILSCGADDQTGAEGRPCHPDDTCSHNLVCVDGICVPSDCEEDCSDLDGWYDVAEAYDCCDEASVCSCLEQDYLEHVCLEAVCVDTVTDTRILLDNCMSCEDGNPCTANECREGKCEAVNLPAGTPCGSTGECDGYGLCSQTCDIDNVEYSAGQISPFNECEICDPTAFEEAWSPHDGVECEVEDPCERGLCEGGECRPEPVCEGTDIDCGCDSCVDCTLLEGWVEVGEAYFACDSLTGERCAAQDREFLEFRCEDMLCVSEVIDSDTVLSDCALCDDGNPCTVGSCSEGECVLTPNPGAACGVSGECDEHGYCDEGCVIDGESFADGSLNPHEECLRCSVHLSQSAWSPAPDGTVCGDDDPCMNSYCMTGTCVSETLPSSTAPTEVAGDAWTCSGTATTLTATGGTHGNEAIYEWGTGDCGATPIPGATSDTYETGELTADVSFWVRRTGGCGGTTDCAVLDVVVGAEPRQPSAIVGPVAPCAKTEGIQYSVNEEAGVQYSWSVPSDWGITEGDDTHTITVTSGANDGVITVTPSNQCGVGPAQSLSVSTVGPPAHPGRIKGPAEVCSGVGNSFGVDPVSGATHYTWDYEGEGVLDGAGTRLNLTATSSGTLRVRAHNTCGAGEWSETDVEVHEPVSAGRIIVKSQKVCEKPGIGILELAGHTGEVIRWDWTQDGGATWTGVPSSAGVEKLNVPLEITPGSYAFRAVIQNGPCEPLFATTKPIEVKAESHGGEIAGMEEICVNGGTVELTLFDHVGAVNKWQVWSRHQGWQDISNTSTTHSLELDSAGSWTFRAEVQNSPCDATDSATHLLRVDSESFGGKVEGEQTQVCLGTGTGTLTLEGHVGSVQYWERNRDDSGWSQLDNQSTTHSETPLERGQWEYRANVRNGVCSTTPSKPWTVYVAESVGGVIKGGGTTICRFDDPETLKLEAHSGQVLTWQLRVGEEEFMNIPDSVGLTEFEPDGISQPGQYEFRAVVEDGSCGQVYSTTTVITVVMC